MTDYDEFATKIRVLTCEMFIAHGDGHVGGSFSIVEALSVLFNKYINQEIGVRDWFVLSKGHAGPAYYATLVLKGIIPKEKALTLNDNGTILPSHPDRSRTPGVDCSTGSLGQGISQAVGIAKGLKIQGKKGFVYCIVGDGELNEGETYEALEFAGHNKLDNLIIFIDNNKKQVDGFVSEISCDYDYEKFVKSLGLDVITIAGNDTKIINETISAVRKKTNATTVIILDTIKGYGIDYFVNMPNCHHVTFNNESISVMKKYVAENKEI